MRHTIKVVAYAFFSLLAVMTLGLGVHAGIDWAAVAAVGLAAVVSALTVVVGAFGLITARMTLKLSAVGRLLECATFTLVGGLFIWLAGLVAPSVLTVTHPIFAGFATVVGTVILAAVTGQIKSFGAKSWLPARMK